MGPSKWWKEFKKHPSYAGSAWNSASPIPVVFDVPVGMVKGTRPKFRLDHWGISWCENAESLSFNSDHDRKWYEVFVNEPYSTDPEYVAECAAWAARNGLHYILSGKAFHCPGKIIRHEFWPIRPVYVPDFTIPVKPLVIGKRLPTKAWVE
jgi:hypothetical protein